MAEPDDSPLHTAIKERRTLEEIRSIVEADRSLLRRRAGMRADLPIHLAIEGGSPSEIVAYLLEQWPDSIRERSGFRNNLPVHLACGRYHDHDTATVHLLVEAWPESLGEGNGDGNLPVHRATSLDLIQYLVERRPQSVREPGYKGRLLIHHAVELSLPLPAIKFVLESWPLSIREKDKEGWTVMHFICTDLSIESIDYLLEQGGEDLLMEADKEGNLPLHLILSTDEELESREGTVQHLINRAPQSVRVRSNNGYLPLHVAMEREMPLSLIRFLVRAWPQAVRETTNEGFLPLHVAANAGELDYIEYLVVQWAESVEIKSSNGWLAVHLVLQNDTYRFDVQRILATARFLIDRFPRSVHEATNEGLLPLHVAARSGFGSWVATDNAEENDVIELAFVRFLVSLAPLSVRVASNEVLFPFDYAIRARSRSLPTIRFFAEQWPDVTRHCDSEGRTPLHAATSQSVARPDIVRFVADLRPQMHERRDEDGSLPLHAAVASLPSRYDLLYSSNPENFRYQHDFLPGVAKAMELVRYLAEQRPQSLAEGDNLGALPLHAALARDLQSLDMVRLLVELRPKSLRAADNNGALPLHIAVAHSQPRVPIFPDSNVSCDTPRPTPALDLVKFLVKQSPKSVRHKDSQGNVPLLVAASHDADLDVIFFLATEWPIAIYESRGTAEQPPSRPLKRSRVG